MQRTIRDIIDGQALVAASSSTTVSEAARSMKDARVGAIAVVDEGRLVGVFTERDALVRVVAAGLDPLATTLAAVMTRDPVTCSPGQSFTQALQLMHDHRFRHVPVVDRGTPVGMVSVRDAMGPELEAFVYELLRQEASTNVLA